MSQNGLPDLPDEADVKKRQMLLVSVVVIIVVIVLLYAYLTNPTVNLSGNQQRPVEVNIATPGKSNDPIQNWVLQNENKMKAYEENQAKQKKETDAKINLLMQEINKLNQDNRDLNTQLKAVDATDHKGSGFPPIPLPPLSSLPVSKPQVLAMPESGESPSKTDSATDQGKSFLKGTVLSPAATSRIVRVKFQKKGKKKKPHIRDTIPAGAFGRAVLLSGLDAPTGGLAERNPHPVLLELIDNGSLPNRYRHRVKQCRVVGSGTGNISDERAYIRLERMTCILKNGDIISEVATGTITGEDGKNGLRGNLVTKQGQLIANAFWAGSLSNIGSAIAQSYTSVATTAQGTVSTLDPSKVLESGVAGGVGNTMEKIADWYFKRAEETYPIIEISAGRIVNLFLTEDLPLNTNLLSNYTPESIHE
jgi:conjugal transfer pilus assembly protein TraB